MPGISLSVEAAPENQMLHRLHAPRTRWGAFGIHLALSALIFVSLVGFIVVWLFPGALFQAAGGWQGIRIIAGVDLVLGPLLTLIVYDIGKPRRELVRDLSVIGTIQIAALLAGMYIVYQQRPVTVTWAHDRFHVSVIGEYRDADIARADVRHTRPFSPAIVYIELPQDDRLGVVLTSYELSREKMYLRTDLAAPLPDTPELAAPIMQFNRLSDTDSKPGCVPVLVQSRFDEFTLCYDIRRQRFSDP